MNNNEYEEFSVGNMAPVVRPDQVLSKNQNTEEYSDDISKGIANEFDALDMMVPGSSVTENDETDDEDEVTEATDEEKNHSASMKAIVKANRAKVGEAERELKSCKKSAEKVRREFKDLCGKVKYHPILKAPDYDMSGDKINSITCTMDLFTYKKGSEVDASQISKMKKALQSSINVTKRKLVIFDASDDKTNKISVKVTINDVIQPQPAEIEEAAVISFDESEDSEFMTESTEKIDDDIKPMIVKLNEKGYKTKYSCSGHPSARFKKDKFRDGILYDKLYSSARIVFDGTYDISAPNHWKKKTLNDGKNTAIYVKAPQFKIVDGLPKDAFYKWKDKYMNALEKWVDDLPKAGEKSEKDEKEEDITESVYLDLFLDI